MQTAVKVSITKTKEFYQERMDSIIKMLEEGIKSVFTSGHYQDYLRTMAKFYNYSFRNTFLIFMQRPDSTNVAGFYTWKREFERSVNKGETGIKILAPYFVKKSVWADRMDNSGQIVYDPNTGKPDKELITIDIQKFKVVSVFDVSQTSGKPIPSLVSELKANVENADEIMKAILKCTDASVEFAAIRGGARGFYIPWSHSICIKEGMSELQTCKTAIHEIVHSRLDRKENNANKKDRADQEIIAESVAFCVCQFLNLSTEKYSFPYVASWAGNQDLKKLSECLATIQKESDEIIKILIKELGL